MTERQTSRLSLPTYHRYQDPPHRHKLFCQKLSYIFICICAIVIGYEITRRKLASATATKDNIHNEISQENQQISNISILQNQELSRKQLDNWAKNNQINIPLVNTHQRRCPIKDQHHLQQENKINTYLFESLHKQYQYKKYLHYHELNPNQPRQLLTNIQTIHKYLIEIKPLSALKHQKFTSPSKAWSSRSYFRTILFQDEDQKYDSINQIFTNSNLQVWQSSGKYLTFFSNEPIKPTLIVLNIGYMDGEKQNKVHLFGLSAYETVLANQNTLSSTLITKTFIKQGVNIIQCNKIECNEEYSMIMVMMEENIRIRGIRLFTRKQH